MSCGFDAHRDDPLASMQVSRRGFRGDDAHRCARSPTTVCGGRVVFVLEGGYAPSGLCEGTSAVLDALLRRRRRRSLADAPEAAAGSTLAQVIRQVAAVHRDRYADLGAA